ncbi:hypothetical protein AGLY_012084 [Aphis glycines]|uniref:MULE transposase domain-containing protein n=1 Tax=Aphis glycines TaxID=307491 RepID=A0A6G0T946_APHGL|nr:hypothetical protein AGLY_012084 [Aphis glycines]
MGSVKQKRFCIWHVHEAWRKNLSKINNKEKRITVRKILYDLSTELDEEAFKNKLYTFLSNIDEDLQKFLNYFFQYYGQNPQYWAYCYRQYAGCNTNMNLESFHRVLKEKIICKLEEKSVYNCLCYLEKYLIMKENDVQKKQLRTKRTNKLKMLRINHKKFETEPKCDIKPLSFNSWNIKSFTDEKINIVLKTELKECSMYANEFTCSLPCTICKTCFHDFICSCPDHSKNNIEMAQDQQQVQHLEDDLQTHQDDSKNILLDNLRNKILKEIELSLQNVKTKNQLLQINRKLIGSIHAFISASNVETSELL